MQESDTHTRHETLTRCGYVALLGTPNAGKSTLLNRLLDTKLAIVTPKAQTTRHRILGIVQHKTSQILCLDVPGVFDAGQKKLENAMVQCAWAGVADADVVCFLLDAKQGLKPEHLAILDTLKTRQKRTFLVVNKIDTLDTKQLLPLVKDCNDAYPFAQSFMISALSGDGVATLKDALADAMPVAPFLYDPEQLTEMPERVLASELTREQCFMLLRQELPYALTVETEGWQEQKDGSVRIEQVITVEREGQKAIILGKQGAQLKKIGEAARREIAKALGRKAHLFLFVKVRGDWRERDEHLQYLGLHSKC